jgi:myosin-crossreactive antigen
MTSKSIQDQAFTTINESIKLTKKQNEILTMVCDLYEMKVGEYIKDALIESLKEELTDGDFCKLLASKLDDGKKADKSKAGDRAVSDQVNGNNHSLSSYPPKT